MRAKKQKMRMLNSIISTVNCHFRNIRKRSIEALADDSFAQAYF